MPRSDIQRLTERIGDLFDAASELPGEARSAYLDQHLDVLSQLDRYVRAEVERLLLHHDDCGILDETVVRRPAIKEAQQAFHQDEMLADRFRVRRMLGAGGMGEVYEAEDLTTGQTIALKTVRPDVALDSSQAERFRRELLMCRQVAHRNVCRVFEFHDIEHASHGRLQFFTMELLAGETLAQRLGSAQRFDPEDAIAILAQVAEGLDEVHRCGVIHRDLKPSNIFLVPDPRGGDRAVVMDFGLARSVAAGNRTTTGTFMGTRLYMAPEQPVSISTASDIYSFGVMAFEIVTGSPSPLVPPSSVITSLDRSWDKALLACLDMNPVKRPATAGEVVRILRAKTRPWRIMIYAAVSAAVLAASAVATWSAIRASPGATQSSVQITSDTFTVDPTTSNDGQLLAYSSDRDSEDGSLNIWIQNLDSGTPPRRITNEPGDEDEPTLSGDGTMIAWRARKDNALYLQPVSGGRPRLLAKHGLAPRFSPDGRYVAYWDGVEGDRNVAARSWIVPLNGGAAWNLAPTFVDARLPAWSEDGKLILFRGSKEILPKLREPEEWWVAPFNERWIHASGSDPGAAVDPQLIRATGIGSHLQIARLEDHDSPGLWTGSRVIFAARAQTVVPHMQAGTGTNLYSITLIPFLQTAMGSPQSVTAGGVLQDVPSLMPGGRIAYADLHDIEDHVFAVNAESGELKPRLTSRASIDTRVSASADGQVVVFGRRDSTVRSVWTLDRRTGVERMIADNEFAVPFVSADGRTAAMSSGNSIRLIDIATGRQTTICPSCGELRGWVPRTEELLFRAEQPGSLPAIKAIYRDTKTIRTILSSNGINEAAVSPDGEAIAFTIRQGMYSTIYIARVAEGIAVGPWQLVTSTEKWSDKPVWAPDGRTLFFRSTEDGFSCIWKRATDSHGALVTGPLQSLAHFHRAALTMSALPPMAQGLAFGGGELFLSLEQAAGNIWTIR